MKKKSAKEAPSAKPAATEPTRRAEPLLNPYWLLPLAWLIPGAGHFALGDRRRGIGFFVLLLITMSLGYTLDGALYWDFDANSGPLVKLASLASLAAGLPFIVLQFFLDYFGNPRGEFFEQGTAFFISAGLLNVVLLLNTWDLTWGLVPEATETPEVSNNPEGQAA